MKRILVYMLTVCLCFSVLAACAPSAAAKAEVPNPISEKKSIEEIDKTIGGGFKMLQLPEKYTPDPEGYAVIDGKLAQMDYGMEGKDTVITFRMMEGSDDVSGIYGVEYDQETINGIETNVGTYNDIHVAWFTHDGNTYSLTATDMNGSDFMTLVNEVTVLISSPPEEE